MGLVVLNADPRFFQQVTGDFGLLVEEVGDRAGCFRSGGIAGEFEGDLGVGREFVFEGDV